jgi:hypothetical protein
MKCEECELLLAGGEAEASVEDHLRGCAECRRLRDELRENALALSSLRDDELPRVTTPKRRPVLRWIAAAAAAAVLLALIAHQTSQRRPVVETTLRPRQVTAPVTVTAEPAIKPAERRKRKPTRGAQPQQPLLVKMLTPDPDVVVYWIVD